MRVISVPLRLPAHKSRRSRGLPDATPFLPKLWVLAVLLALIVGASGFTYWVANYNNRVPTPIDGIWSVIAQEGNEGSLPKLTRVFCERNRAFLVVFRLDAGTDEWHHFELDGAGTYESGRPGSRREI